MASIKEWSETGAKIGLFFPRLQISTGVENLQALFSAIPLGTQAAMSDPNMRAYMHDGSVFYCSHPCLTPYDHLTVDAMKTYITLMALPMAALKYYGEQQDLARYMIELANATVGAVASVKVNALGDLNSKYFNGMLQQYAFMGQNLAGVWVLPVFLKSTVSGVKKMWNWWRAGARIPVPNSNGALVVTEGVPTAEIVEMDSKYAQFPAPADISPEMKEAVVDLFPDFEYGTRNSLTFSDELSVRLSEAPFDDASFVHEVTGFDDYALVQEGHEFPTESSGRFTEAELTGSAESSKFGTLSKKLAVVGKVIIVLVSAAIVVLEVLSIVSTVQVYDQYKDAIEQIASSTTEYYEEVIAAAQAAPTQDDSE